MKRGDRVVVVTNDMFDGTVGTIVEDRRVREKSIFDFVVRVDHTSYQYHADYTGTDLGFKEHELRLVKSDRDRDVDRNCNDIDQLRQAVANVICNRRNTNDDRHNSDLVFDSLDIGYICNINVGRAMVIEHIIRQSNDLDDLREAKRLIERCALYEFGEQI